jgi:heme-degrading monooxygenase HmoA
MYIRIVHHWCKEERREDGIALMHKTGETTSQAPGFIHRQILANEEDAALLTSLTAWESDVAFEAFRASRPASNHADPASPFERIAHESYSVVSSVGLDIGR